MSRNSKSQSIEVKPLYTSAIGHRPASPSDAISSAPIPPSSYPAPPPPSTETTIQCNPKSDSALPLSPPLSNTTTHLANSVKPEIPLDLQPYTRPPSTHNQLGPKPRPIPPALPPIFPPRPPPNMKCHAYRYPPPEISIHELSSNTPGPKSSPNTRSTEALRICQTPEQCIWHPVESSKAEEEVSTTDQEAEDSSAKKTQVDDRGEIVRGLHLLYLRGGGNDEDEDEGEIAQTPQESLQHRDHPISPATGSSQDLRGQRSQGLGARPIQDNQHDQSVQRRQRSHRSQRHSTQLTSSAHQGNSTHLAQVFPWPPLFPPNPSNVSGGRIVNLYTYPRQGQTSMHLPQWNNVPVIHQTALPVVSSPSSSVQLAGVPRLSQSPNLVISPHLVHGPAYAPPSVENNPPIQFGSIASRPLNPQAPDFAPQQTVPDQPHYPLAGFDRFEGPGGMTGPNMYFPQMINAGYDDENKRLKGDVNRLEFEKETAEGQLHRLQIHLTIVEGIKAMEKAEGERLRAQSRKIGRERESLRRQVTELEVQLRTANSERNKLKEENSELEGQLKGSIIWKENYQRVSDTYCRVSDGWITERVNLRNRIEVLQTEVDNLKSGIRRTEVGGASTPELEESYKSLAPDGELEHSSTDIIQVDGSGDLGNSHSLSLRGGGGDEVEGDVDSVQNSQGSDCSIPQEPHCERGQNNQSSQKQQRSHPGQDGQQILRYQTAKSSQSGQSRYSSSVLQSEDRAAHISGLQSQNRPVMLDVQGGRSRKGQTAQAGNSVTSSNPASPTSPSQASKPFNPHVSSDSDITSWGPRVLQDQRDQKGMRKKRGQPAGNDKIQSGQQAQKRQRRQEELLSSHPDSSGHSMGMQQPAQVSPWQSGFHAPSVQNAGLHTFIFFTDGTANYFGFHPQPLRMAVHPTFVPPSPGPHAFTFFPDGTAHYFGYNPQPLSMAFSSSSWDRVPVMYQISPPVVSSLPFTDVSSPNLVVGQYQGRFPQSASFPDFNPQLGTIYCTPYSSLKWISAESELRQREILERRIRDQATLEEMSERYRRLQQGVVHLKAKNDNIVPGDMELLANSATIGNQLEVLRGDLVAAKKNNEKLQKRRGIADFDKADVEDELRISRYEAKKRLDAELHPSKESS